MDEMLKKIKDFWLSDPFKEIPYNEKRDYINDIDYLIKTIEQQQEDRRLLDKSFYELSKIISEQENEMEEYKKDISNLNEELHNQDQEIERLKEGIDKVLKYMEHHSGTVEVPKRLTTDGLFDLYRLAIKLIK